MNTVLPKPIQATARLIERKMLADTVYEFKFQMIQPAEIDFKAGQYIAIEIDPRTRRQYSISSAPSNSKDMFEIVIDIKPDGIGTKYLMDLKPNDEIKFIGQIGMFYLPEDYELAPNLFFISTGTGLAPLKSMIEELIATKQNKNHNTFLYFGTRYINDIFYEDLFNQYFNERNLTEFRIYLSQASMPGAIEGYVTQFIDLTDESLLQDAQFFICGSGKMIRDVEKELKEKGVDENNIIYEKFY